MADIIAATSALDTAAGGDATRRIVERLPLGQRIKYGLIAFAWQKLMALILSFKQAKKYFSAPSPNDPDVVKRYPSLKSLPIR